MKEPHIYTPAQDPKPAKPLFCNVPRAWKKDGPSAVYSLFPLMTQPCRPVEREKEASYMRGLLDRTIAMLREARND